MVTPAQATPPLAQPMPIAPPRLTVFDTGAEQCPQGQLPGALELTPAEQRTGINPLHFVPVVGMIYRAITGETAPPPMQIAASAVSSAAFGGPMGLVGTLVLNAAMELARLGPDTSRPAAPEGMDATGSEAGVRSISPADPTKPGGYTTLATVMPDFLGGGTAMANATPVHRAIAAYAAGTATGYG